MAFASCFGPFCGACGWALRVERCECGGGPVCAFDALRACNGGGVASIGDLFVAVGYATPRLPSVSAVKWLAAMITRACPCGVVVVHLDHDVCCRFLPRGRIVRISLIEALEFLRQRICVGFAIRRMVGLMHLDVVSLGWLRRAVSRRRKRMAQHGPCIST